MDNQSMNTATVSAIAIPIKVLDSLCSRFLLNLPPQERNDNIRVMFQIELAHWFYIDFYRVEMPGLPGCGIKEFAKIIFNHCPFLNEHLPNVEKIYSEWREYKMSVPTYGAIMLDETMQYIVMVQSFFSKTSWGFPKGKVNEGEEPHQCAVREVREETGYDISDLIVENDYIETTFNEQLARLYIVPKVPMEAKFEPQTRGEIRGVKWFHIDDLPSHKKDMAPKQNLGLNPNNFFMAIPFIKPLKKRINKRKGKSNQEDRDSPLAALKNSLAGNQQQYQQQVHQSPQQPSKPSTNNLDPTHKQRQQRAFAQQNQSELSQYLKYKDPSMKDPNVGNANGRPQYIGGGQNQYQQKGRGRNSNPNTPQKTFQILTRDGRIAGKSAFTSLETDSVPVQPPNISKGSQPQVMNNSILYSKTLMNFRFNMADIMKACEGF
ncbi:m7GpppN-mRNA hydrolase-like [Amphiura filiformis]|uniref:m7GpppN-mRNA hydrolase-like n=1 Tax=Amphiura filiformis TaxID=82378 RepID=UPI003B2139EC